MNEKRHQAHNHPIMVVVNIQSPLVSQADLYAFTTTLVHATRQEPGCIEYNCYRSIDDASVTEVIIFDSLEAHKAHMNSPHVLAFMDEHQSLDLQYRVQRVNYVKNAE